jgi:uncharacterized membrane protein
MSLGLKTTRRPLIAAGVVLGAGIGGFFDGIVFHQLLQWHHMVSVPYPPTSVGNLQLNTLGDGLFHLGTYIMVGIGLFLLYRATRFVHVAMLPRTLLGTMLIGFGLFNLIEGTVNHHILQIHHVREVPEYLVYDLAFLAAGLLLCLAGYALQNAESYRSLNRNLGVSRMSKDHKETNTESLGETGDPRGLESVRKQREAQHAMQDSEMDAEEEREKHERGGVPGKSSTYSLEERDQLNHPQSGEAPRSGTDPRQ